jgi:hypothetical protein
VEAVAPWTTYVRIAAINSPGPHDVHDAREIVWVRVQLSRAVRRIPALGRFLPLACGTNDNQLSTISVRSRTQNLRFFRRQNTFIVFRSSSLLHCSKHNQIRIAHFSKGRTGAAFTCLEKATGAAAREALLRERARDWSLSEARGLPALRWRQEWDQGDQWLAPPGVCHASDP